MKPTEKMESEKYETQLSAIEKFEVKLWSSFLRKVSGFERKFVFLGVIRAVSLPITFFAVCISGFLSAIYGGFRTDLFLVDMFGLLLAHAASNVFNDIWDYKNKVDSPEYFRMRYNVHPVELMGMRKSLILGFLLSFLALLCGIYITLERGLGVLILAALGFILLFSYSGPPLKLKYIGMGEPLVFFVWGPLMIAGSFWVITGVPPTTEVLFSSFPYGITASLILFGKHLDKLEDDAKKGVRTLPVLLGEKRTKYLVAFLVFLVYLTTAIMILWSGMVGLSLTFLSFPKALRVVKEILKGTKPRLQDELPSFYPKEFFPMWYVGGAFIFNVDFALSFILGLIFQLALIAY